jgi:type IV pilus assembly protein PilV
MGNEKGVTLVEVMIALLIFTVGILAVADMQVSSLRSMAATNKGMYDTAVAGARLEEILSKPYDHPSLRDVDDGYDESTPDHGPFAIQPTGSTIEWEVDDDFPVPGTKRITVTVRWSGSDGRRKQFAYTYLKARHSI